MIKFPKDPQTVLQVFKIFTLHMLGVFCNILFEFLQSKNDDECMCLCVKLSSK